jgi:hypothetical protein
MENPSRVPTEQKKNKATRSSKPKQRSKGEAKTSKQPMSAIITTESKAKLQSPR